MDKSDAYDFTEDEKNRLYDKIKQNYFETNFGSMSKADFETMLFSEFIEHCIKSDVPYDDYSLSKQLGITQSRIRTLKERKELKYPNKGFDWRKSFVNELKHARYDKDSHRINVIIEDVNVMAEVKHFIEQNGWYDECTLNKKLLRIPLECFVDIFCTDEELNIDLSESAKKKIRKIPEHNIELDMLADDFSKDRLKKLLAEASGDTLSAVIECIPFGGIAKMAFQAVGKVISKSTNGE